MEDIDCFIIIRTNNKRNDLKPDISIGVGLPKYWESDNYHSLPPIFE
jgi:hypothetical protein